MARRAERTVEELTPLARVAYTEAKAALIAATHATDLYLLARCASGRCDEGMSAAIYRRASGFEATAREHVLACHSSIDALIDSNERVPELIEQLHMRTTNELDSVAAAAADVPADVRRNAQSRGALTPCSDAARVGAASKVEAHAVPA